MKTVCLLNLKGGVGKTVTAVNLAHVLAADYHQRVLLADADSQGNATELLGGDPKLGNLADLLSSPCRVEDMDWTRYVQHTPYSGLTLLAASDALMDLDVSKLAAGRVRASAVRELAEALDETSRCDYLLIDCPPAFSAASAAALLAADEVIIPIKLDAFSLRGMANLIRQVDNMRRLNSRLRVAGCLATMWYNDPAVREAEKQLRACALPVFRTVIRRSAKMDGSTFAQKPLALYSPHCGARVDYRRFTEEYLEGGARHV